MNFNCKAECTTNRKALQDTLEVINGKWKMLILITLMESPYRFKELVRVVGITPRMLSRELQTMELNRLVSRTVQDTKPISVEYAITPYGRTLKSVFREMVSWGIGHRELIMHPESRVVEMVD